MGFPDTLSADDIRAAQDGDEEAFARIYRSTQPWLVKYVSVIDRSDVDDICAETWVQVCRDLRSFRGDADGFRAWIVRIARNRAVDAARSRQRRPADLVAPEAMPVTRVEESGEAAAFVSMSTADALRVIGGLPAEQAEAVLLRCVFGLDAKAAAKILGKRPGAVRTAAYRGLRELRDRYAAASDPAQGDVPR